MPTTYKTKLQILRENFFDLYFKVSIPAPERLKPLTEEQILEVNSRLTQLEEFIPEYLSMNKYDQKRNLYKIRDLFSYIDDLDLPVDLAQRASSIISEESIHKLKDIKIITAFRSIIERYKRKCIRSIGTTIESTNDIDALQKLAKSIHPTSVASYSNFQSTILQKIRAIKLASYEEYLAIPKERINLILSSLMEPEFDKDSINQALNDMALDYYERKKKVIQETATNSNMAKLQNPTMEGSLKQVTHEILETIQQEGFDIKDPDILYSHLLELGITKSAINHSFIANYINNKRFDEANAFLNKVYTDFKDKNEYTLRKLAEKRIRCAEIADFIMRGIEADDGSIKDEDKYYETIKSGIEQSKIDPSAITLAFSQDGKRKITWADVMERPKTRIERDY